MPDFLTHVLVMYAFLTVASWWIEWVSPPWIVAGMAGGLIPDVSKIELLLPAEIIEEFVGVSFSWFPLTTLPGSLAVAGLLSLFVAAEYRIRAVLVLSAGAVVHLGLDLLLQKPAPTTFPVLYPVSLWEPPTIGVYLSSDVWPSVIALILAGLVALATRVRAE